MNLNMNISRGLGKLDRRLPGMYVIFMGLREPVT